MNRYFRNAGLCLLAAAALVLAACASGPQVSSEADPGADFSRYRSFAFYSPLAIEGEGYASITGERIKAAVRAQMEARGYAYDPQSPDLWVNVNAYLQEKTDVVTMPDVGYDYYYRYRGGYVAVPTWRDRTEVRRYTEGTLNIDLVDVQARRLVWEGVAVGRASGKATQAERGARIDAAVAEIFAQYPHRAGAAR